MNPKTVLKYASDQDAKFVSVRFTDLPGSWQHLTFPIAELGEEQFEDGFGFDASSIRDGLLFTSRTCYLYQTQLASGWIRFQNNQPCA